MSGKLADRRAIVTGANRGLGLDIARHYLAEGADVALGARDATLLREEVRRLQSKYPARRIFFEALDVTSEVGCVEFVAKASEALGDIDVLVNNAGIYGPMGPIEQVDWRQWVDAVSVNLLGSVLMTRAVVPRMKARRSGTIIQVSGGGATNPMPNITSYAASKAAVVRFAESIALELSDFGIDVNSIAPGALNTRLLTEVLAAGPDKVGREFYDRSLKQRETGGVPLEKGAELAVFLASRASRGITGKLISAIWDRYEAWPEHLKELNGSDVYALRRVTGRDRDLTWGDK
jgi:NAD(P)-dependent dehydrogenase (short-subunit alcohol dehydrogenase family)